MSSPGHAKSPSSSSLATDNVLSLELLVLQDGRIPTSILRALSPSLGDALVDAEAARARLLVMNTGQPQNCSVSSGGTRFEFEILPSNELSTGDAVCLKHRVVLHDPDDETSEVARDHLLDQLPLALTIADLSGTIRYVNQAARNLIGLTEDQPVIGRDVWRFVHPEGMDEAQRSGWQVRKGEMASYERHLLRRVDGSRVPVETTTKSISWNGEELVLVAAHDLRGVEAVERALEESQRLFASIFETAPIAISVSRNADQRFVDVNPAFVEYVGLPRSEILGRSLAELDIDYDRGAVETMRRELLRGTATGEQVEAYIVSISGVLRNLLLSAAMLDVRGESCMLTIGTDISELHRATRALEESEQRFRLMADAAPVLIWLADRAGECTFFNRQWLEFVGLSMDEQLTAGWLSGVHPDDRDQCMTNVANAISRNEDFCIEYRLRRHDGKYCWMLDRGTIRRDSEGNLAGYIGSCVDITDRREAEERLREAKERAEEMTILKSAFLTNMTHEIRTPLTVILGFTTILRQGTRPEYQRFISLIERSGRRLLLMLDSILDLAQLEAGTLKPEFARQSVAEIAHGVTDAVRPIAVDKGIELTVDVSGDSFVALTDHAILSRVLNNLIDNAVKFTEEGHVAVLIAEAESEVTVEIRDTGIGIHEDFLPRIFDAFSQESTGLARTHQGSGLGLTVSEQLVRLIGGELIMDSEKGVGSTIVIRIPRQPGGSMR